MGEEYEGTLLYIFHNFKSKIVQNKKFKRLSKLTEVAPVLKDYRLFLPMLLYTHLHSKYALNQRQEVGVSGLVQRM